MTPNQYQQAAMRTNDGKCSERLQKVLTDKDTGIKVGDLVNGIMGLCGESGEVADYVKKAVFHHHPFDKEALKKELGDVCWYIAMICHALNIDLEDVMLGNIKKLQARYPEGFSEEASLHRDTSKE